MFCTMLSSHDSFIYLFRWILPVMKLTAHRFQRETLLFMYIQFTNLIPIIKILAYSCYRIIHFLWIFFTWTKSYLSQYETTYLCIISEIKPKFNTEKNFEQWSERCNIGYPLVGRDGLLAGGGYDMGGERERYNIWKHFSYIWVVFLMQCLSLKNCC